MQCFVPQLQTPKQVPNSTPRKTGVKNGTSLGDGKHTNQRAGLLLTFAFSSPSSVLLALCRDLSIYLVTAGRRVGSLCQEQFIKLMEKSKNIKLNNRAAGLGVYIIIQPDLVKRRVESLALTIAPPKKMV